MYCINGLVPNFDLQGLKAMDSNGLSDPYVKLHLLPGASKVCINNPNLNAFPQAIILMNFKGKKEVQFDIAYAQLVHKIAYQLVFSIYLFFCL